MTQKIPKNFICDSSAFESRDPRWGGARPFLWRCDRSSLAPMHKAELWLDFADSQNDHRVSSFLGFPGATHAHATTGCFVRSTPGREVGDAP